MQDPLPAPQDRRQWYWACGDRHRMVEVLTILRRDKSLVDVEPTRYEAGSEEDADGHRYRLGIQPKAKRMAALLQGRKVWSSGTSRSCPSFPREPCLPHLRGA